MVLARGRLAAGVIFLAAWIVYWNSLGGEFVFDDTSIIQSNPQIRGLNADNLSRIFGSHYWQTAAGQGGLYRPVVILSYALNHAAGGLDPWGYHFVNVLLHALNAVLVFVVIEELFQDRRFAFWSGVLFALHPIRSEGVAYVAGRAEPLAALFFLAAWWCYLRRRWAAGAVAFLLAALSKESAFTFLLIPVLSDVVRRRKPEPIGWAGFALAAAAALGLRHAVLGGVAPLAISHSANPLAAAPAAARLFTAVEVAGRYVWLLLFPVPLSADYSFNQIPVVTTPWGAGFLVSAALLLGLAALLPWCLRRAPPLFLCLALFFGTFSLTSNLLRPIGTIMAERLMYLPSMGFTCALAWALSKARNRDAATAAALLLALLYGGRTIVRNQDWNDHLALFSSAAVVSPGSALVQANLANALLHQARDPKGAVEHALAATRIEPSDPAAHMTLADARAVLGDLPGARSAYAQVEKLAPGTGGAQEAARRRLALGDAGLGGVTR